MRTFHRFVIHFALAHQALDHVRTQHVIGLQHQSAPDRQFTGIDGGFPFRQLTMALAEAVTDMADGTHAQANQVGFGMRGIAHEIAVQATTLLCLRQVVAGQGEMVHADVHITGSGKLFHRQPQQREFLFGAGQVFVMDLALRLEHVRHVRITVDRQAVRTHRHHCVQGARESIKCLQGQAVDQVHVDRAHALLAAGLQHGHGFFHALDAVDGHLHLRIEILHPQTGAVEADAGKFPDVFRGDVTRIQFNGEIAFRPFAEAEMPAHRVQQPLQQGGTQEVGRATTQVHLDHFTIQVEKRCYQRDLFLQARQIGFTQRSVVGDLAIAATVETGVAAIRDVRVQRQLPRERPHIAVGGHARVLRRTETGMEIRGGGIRGVTRSGTVVAAQKLRVERPILARRGQQNIFHGRQCAGHVATAP